jgi:Protein of unknown function (DUF2934)
MGTVRKGRRAVPRRAKGEKEQLAAVADGFNGSAAQILDTETDLHIETIRLRAYHLFLERGAAHGNDLADWFKAEQELRAARRL